MSRDTKQVSSRDEQMVIRNDDMGPLPEGDRQDSLQQLSLQAFRIFLPVDMFLFRRQPEDDKGIDSTLEAKLRGRFTNCRANVQLKSTDKPKRNTDGSVSYSIKISNLNYLLNGISRGKVGNGQWLLAGDLPDVYTALTPFRQIIARESLLQSALSRSHSRCYSDVKTRRSGRTSHG
jgi:hypothetical protein